MEVHDSGVAGGAYASTLGDLALPGERLRFLRTMQRLLKDGDFTATYKFALLQALLDIAVECRDGGDGEVEIRFTELAERFLEYYWTHADPYRPGADGGGVLYQAPGKQAAVVSRIEAVRGGGTRTLAQFRRDPGYARALSDIAKVIREQPVRYLQNLKGERVEFLFRVPEQGGRVVLKAGVASCLREFYDLIQGQLRSRWVERVRTIAHNRDLIGGHRDLEVFLFGQPRNLPPGVRKRLLEIDGERCFYCDHRLGRSMDVEHFVPWSRYPHDRGHNLVLAHPECNNSKKDMLAGRVYLECWLERLKRKSGAISDALGTLLLCDKAGSLRVAQWVYAQEIECGGMFWSGDSVRHADDDLRRLIASGMEAAMFG